MKAVNLLKIKLTLLNYNLSKNDRWMSSRQRKTIGFETIFFLNMSNKKY